MELNALLERLRAGDRLPASEWPLPQISPADAGLRVEENLLLPPASGVWLHEDRLSAMLGGRWSVTVVPAIASTNTELMAEAEIGSVHGRALLAEFQHAGRGRRGRSWVGPVARNLALSLGHLTGRSPFQLGGASLVVGVAVCEALVSLGAVGIGLKWPNDVIVGGAKLSGILVEISSGERNQLVVGVGVNVTLTDAEIQRLDQPATDLTRLGVQADRTLLAGSIIARIGDYLDQFEQSGFPVFQARYDALHAYQDRACRVTLGGEAIEGVVRGVLPDGRLRLETRSGLREFSAGEVSLRPQPTTIAP